jgi:signal transduction histidine kinase
MSASTSAGPAGSPAPLTVPLLPGSQPTAWKLVLGGWTIVGLGYFASLSYNATPDGADRLSMLVYALGTGWLWAALTPLVLWAIRHSALSSGRWEQSVGLYALTGAFVVLLAGFLKALLAVGSGMKSWDQFERVALYEGLETRILAFFAIISLGWSARYYALYRTRHLHASDLETRLAKTHLQVFKMQLQPHFLFNTLNTIAELVHTDPEAADQMITRLGRLLRLSLDHASHQVVPLRQEADFLRVYIDIEQVRFQDRLQVVWDLAPDTLEAAVPTLLWQPVLENAIRHGVTPLAGRGRVVIASRREVEDLVLEIRDNGQGLPPGGAPREGVGLRNVRERLNQLYGPRARFSLMPALGGGTVATLRLPFIHCEVPHTPVPLPGGPLEELVR